MCKSTDVVEIFKCCETKEAGNKNYAYNCQAELTKAGCTTTDVCTANYKKGLEAYQLYKKNIEAQPPAVVEEVVTDKIWFKIVVYGLVPLVGILLIVLLVWAYTTKCGKQPCRKNKSVITKTTSGSIRKTAQTNQSIGSSNNVSKNGTSIENSSEAIKSELIRSEARKQKPKSKRSTSRRSQTLSE